MEELDLKELFKYFLKNFWVILLITIVVLVGGEVYSNYLKTPMYNSTTTLILATNGGEQQSTITQADISINQNLVNTYKEIVKSKKVLNKSIKNLKLKYTYEGLAKNTSVSAKENTEIINVTITDKDPKRARLISDEVAKNFKEEVEAIYNMKNVSILDGAEVSKKPYNHKLLKETIMYLGFGLVLSLIVLFIKFYFDSNVKTAEEVETKVELPIMGNIRDCTKEIEKNKLEDKLLIDAKSMSNFAEDIKTIRTNLDFSAMEGSLKRILITSSIPGDGKSFVSSNLAASFAQNNKRVILIDCDLRKGVVHKRFNKENIGLSNLIAKNDLENLNSYIRHTDVRGLDIITRGTTPPNPSELLDSMIMKNLLRLLEANYDYIIFDAPPVTNLPDALIVSSMVDKTLIVTSIGHTPMDLLLNTKKSLMNVNAPIAGIIVNKVPIKKGGYYYSNYKYE